MFLSSDGGQLFENSSQIFQAHLLVQNLQL